MKQVLYALVLVLPISAQADYYPVPENHVFGQAPSYEDKKAVDELMQRFKEAWANEDATAVAATHSADTEWTNAFGRILRGSDALKDFLENDLFPEFDSEISKREMENYKQISRRYLGRDAVIIQAYTESNRGSSVGAGNRKIYLNFVLSKNEGKWVIVHQVITDVRERR